MDGSAAIERNRVALKRIVASLVAMAGLGNRHSAIGSGQSGSAQAAERTMSDCLLPTADCRPTLPRHLWLAILRLLRPAEAAARRLIIAAARGLVVPAPSPRKAGPKPETMEPLLRRLGIAVVVSPAGLSAEARRAKAEGRGGVEPQPSAARVPAFPLLDPLRRPLSLWDHGHYRRVPAHAAPRILLPGVVEPSPLPPPPSPDDPVSAAHLGQRLAALAAALDDLPGQARRLARWKARLDADRASGQFRRISPLRRGPPPGGRLARYDPTARPGNVRRGNGRRRSIREVDEILAHAHELAIDALERPDTS